jgi:hypothetical protein
LSVLSSSSSMARDADAGEADWRREGRHARLVGAHRGCRPAQGRPPHPHTARPLGRNSPTHGRATGAGEAAAPAWPELAGDADRRRGDHRACALPARLAGAHRLEHGRATGWSAGGWRPGSTRSAMGRPEEGTAAAGRPDQGSLARGQSEQGMLAARRPEQRWQWRESGEKRKKYRQVGPTKVYKITQMRYVQARSCHVSTDMSEIVLVGLNRTISVKGHLSLSTFLIYNDMTMFGVN